MKDKIVHILLADDDEDDRYLFNDVFSASKMHTVVRSVKDGAQLMECLKDEDAQLPHILFLDLNMPRKSGLQCLKEIRSNERLKDIYIAIYSTSDNERDIEATFSGGANIYIIKPSDFDALKLVLEKAIRGITQLHLPPKKKNDFLFTL